MIFKIFYSKNIENNSTYSCFWKLEKVDSVFKTLYNLSGVRVCVCVCIFPLVLSKKYMLFCWFHLFMPLTSCSNFNITVFNCCCSVVWLCDPRDTRLLYPPLSPGACSNFCWLSWWCCLTVSSSVAPSPFAFSLSQHQGLFQWVSSLCHVARILEHQL